MFLLRFGVAALKMKVCLDWGFVKCKREFVQACVCTSISQKTMFLLRFGVAALKMKVCLDWGFVKCKREFVQACVCTSINQKNYVPSSFWGSSFEDESVFGLRFCQMQKGICSSLCLHIHKQKNYVPSSFWGSSFEDESVFGLRFCQMQKGICSSLCLHIHKPKNFPGFFKRKPPSSYMLSHHTWSPRAPLINVVAQCMPASEPKWLCLLKPFQAKPCNNIESGERGHASFFAMSVTGWLFFLKIPVCYIYI